MLPFSIMNQYGNNIVQKSINKLHGSVSNIGLLYNTGEFYLRGAGNLGQLGNGSTTSNNYLTWLKVRDDVIDFWLGDGCTLVKTSSNRFWYCGKATTVGMSTNANAYNSVWADITSNILTGIGSVDNIKDIKMGTYSMFILLNNGDLYGTGQNGWGELGLGAGNSQNITFKLSNTNVKEVSLNYLAGYCVKNDGTLYSSGNNSNGALGIGNTSSFSYVWTRCVISDSTTQYVNSVSAGVCGTVYILASTIVGGTNTLHVAGYNLSGRLGTGSTTDSTSFTKITTPSIELLKFNTGNSLSFSNSIVSSSGILSAGVGYATGYPTASTNLFRNIDNNPFIDISKISYICYTGPANTSAASFVAYNNKIYACGTASWLGTNQIYYILIDTPY